MPQSSGDDRNELEQLRQIVQNAREGLAVVQDGGIRYGNPRFFELLGRPEQEGLFQRIDSFVHPDDREIAAALQACLFPGREHAGGHTFRLVHPAGRVVWVEAWSTPLAWDGNPAVLISFADMTRQKALAQELKENEIWFKTLSDASFCGIALHEQGIILDCNQALSDMFGFAREELLGSHLLRFIAGDYHDAVRNKYCSDSEEVYDVHGIRKNGEKYPLQLRGRTIPYKGKHVRFVEAHDMTREREAEKTQAALAALVQHSKESIVVKDRDRRILAANFAFAQACGYADPAALIGKTDAELFGVPEECEPVCGYKADDLKALALPQGEVLIREESVAFPGGKEHVFLTTKYPIYDASGPFAIGIVASDITQRKKSQAERAKLQDRLQTLWNLAKLTDSTYQELCDKLLEKIQKVTDSEYSFFGFLDAAEENLALHSWSRNALAACAVLDQPLHFPISKAGVWAQSVVDRKVFVANDLSLDHPRKKGLPEGHVPLNNLLSVPVFRDGKIVVLAAVANKNRDYTPEDAEQIAALVSSALALIEKRRAEDQLAESEKLFRLLFEDAPIPYVSLDGGGNCISVNKRFCETLGYAPEEVLGRNFFELLSPDWNAHFREKFPRFKVVGEVCGEFEMQKKDGDSIPVAFTGKVGRNADGSFRQAHCVFRDVAAEKAYQDGLIRAKEAAEQANHAKSAFLANMSHELKTPLNGILGMISLLDATPLNEEQEEYVKLSMQSGRRLAGLIEDILDLTRIETGKMRIAEEPVDIAKLFEHVRQLFAATCEQKGVELECIVAPSVPQQLLGDPVRLQQILHKLVGNAVKFTKAGRISCEAYPMPDNTPEVLRVLFSVSDTGAGINENELDKVFEVFTQGSEGMARTFQGAGLGLPIVRQLVTLMGGNLSVASEPGAGTTFHFCLPFKRGLAPSDGAAL